VGEFGEAGCKRGVIAAGSYKLRVTWVGGQRCKESTKYHPQSSDNGFLAADFTDFHEKKMEKSVQIGANPWQKSTCPNFCPKVGIPLAFHFRTLYSNCTKGDST
jgi:hypothetical protein